MKSFEVVIYDKDGLWGSLAVNAKDQMDAAIVANNHLREKRHLFESLDFESIHMMPAKELAL